MFGANLLKSTLIHVCADALTECEVEMVHIVVG